MLYINPLRDIIHFVKDIYWCNIPLNCRHCLFLRQCRKGWKDHRKCNNGCIKINMLEHEKKYREMPTEELEALLRQEQEQDSMPDVDRIKAILRELETRAPAPKVDIDAKWNDFRENYLDGLVKYAEEQDHAKGAK